MFKSKKEKKTKVKVEPTTEVWGQYAPTLQDIISTASRVEFRPDHVEVAPHNFRRTYYVTRMPNKAEFGFLNQFFGFGADVDVSVHIDQADSSRQIKNLTDTISALEAQISLDEKSDRTAEVSLNQTRIQELNTLRLLLQRGEEKMYHLTVIVTVSADSLAQLERACSVLEREGGGRGFQLLDAAYLQQEGLLSVAPLGLNKLRYPMEVFGSFLANMFPFVSSQFSHQRGPLVGFDLVSKAPMFYDAWHSDLTNANMFVSGVSGAGKSYTVKMIVAHSVLHDIQTGIVDWEGEYPPVTRALGGVVVTIDYNSAGLINPCELEEEEYLDEQTGQTLKKVDVREKIDEMVNFTKFAATLTGDEKLTGPEIALIDRLWKKIYREDFGFTEDANSLYETKRRMTGNRLQLRTRRKQPQISDFYALLKAEAEKNARFVDLADRLERITAEGTLGLFDCQSTVELAKAPVIVFDLSKLPEKSDLRKLGQYVALEWLIERFIKKRPNQKKRVIVDEAQEALRDRDGENFAAKFLDTAFSRIRKRGGSAVAASQQFRIFAANEYGASIIRNSSTKLLLQQEKLDADMLRQLFSLEDHELERLFNMQKGNVRWDVNGEIVYSNYEATTWEHKLFNTKHVQSEEGA